MVVTLAVLGWREGAGPAWMTTPAPWRTLGWMVRAHCGELMLAASLGWLWERRTT